MHPNPVYRSTAASRNLEFAVKRGFGILAVNSEDGPLVSHIPFYLSEDGSWLYAHLVRSNPIIRELAVPQPAVVAISGGDGYISPDWYGLEEQVPTWNYVAVHLRGKVERLDDTQLPAILDRLSTEFENRIAGKKPWTAEKMDAGIRERLMRQIVPVRMAITQVDGTWKLSQNKPHAARLGAADGLEANPVGQDSQAIVGLMRSVEDDGTQGRN